MLLSCVLVLKRSVGGDNLYILSHIPYFLTYLPKAELILDSLLYNSLVIANRECGNGLQGPLWDVIWALLHGDPCPHPRLGSGANPLPGM